MKTLLLVFTFALFSRNFASSQSGGNPLRRIRRSNGGSPSSSNSNNPSPRPGANLPPPQIGISPPGSPQAGQEAYLDPPEYNIISQQRQNNEESRASNSVSDSALNQGSANANIAPGFVPESLAESMLRNVANAQPMFTDDLMLTNGIGLSQQQFQMQQLNPPASENIGNVLHAQNGGNVPGTDDVGYDAISHNIAAAGFAQMNLNPSQVQSNPPPAQWQMPMTPNRGQQPYAREPNRRQVSSTTTSIIHQTFFILLFVIIIICFFTSSQPFKNKSMNFHYAYSEL